MINNKIADFITRLNTANNLNKSIIFVPKSNDIISILNIINHLASNILSYQIIETTIKIQLKNKFRIIKLLSTNSRKRFISVNDLRTLDRGLGFYILRTSNGFLSSFEAKKRNIAGELILLFK